MEPKILRIVPMYNINTSRSILNFLQKCNLKCYKL